MAFLFFPSHNSGMFDLHGYFPMILEGMTLTIEVALLSLLIAVILGLFGAIAKLSKSRIARSTATVYTTLIRGIPDLVLMTIIFYGGQIHCQQYWRLTGLGLHRHQPFCCRNPHNRFYFWSIHDRNVSWWNHGGFQR